MTQQEEDNKKKMLLALAIAAGSEAKSYEDLTEEEIKEAVKLYETKGLESKVEKDDPISEQDVQSLIAAAMMDTTEYFKIINVGDEKTCNACKEWIGQIVTIHGEDPRYKTVDDFIRSGGLHPNCRCTMQAMTQKPKMNMKDLNTLAMNSKELKDTVVYRGFVDNNYDPDVEYDYNEDTLVMLTPIGKFVGSTSDGKPSEEIVDEESVIQMAKQTEELLLDKDHASMRGPEDRNSEAYGWISGLKAITGLGDMSGLYGSIKWTSKGIELAKDRVYRFLSPVFELDENNRAVRLVNVALTNRPALPLPPIFNGEAKAEDNISITKIVKDTDNMNKEEIETMISEMITKALEAKYEEKAEEIKNEETKEEVKKESCNEDSVEQKKEDETKDVQMTSNEEVKEEVKKEEEKEVIKKETLNSMSNNASTIDTEPWRKLHGQEFFNWLAKNK